MLHVRVVSPSGVTARLSDYLMADHGVVNLVVLPAVASSPDGDAVQFDVMTSSANGVLRQLRALGLDRTSSIIVEGVDAALAETTHRPEWRQSYHGEYAPVWDVVEATIDETANYSPSFFALLAFAGIIGACGILTNSQILIVGAMVVGPEYNAIIAVAQGIERRRWMPVRRGLLALLVGFVFAIAVTLLFALCIRGLGKPGEQFLHGIRPVSDLINSPNLYSVVVAVVAGIVGVMSLTLAKAGPLVGVFISITTIPAAADIAVSVAFSSWSEALGSLWQLLLNVGLLIVVGAVALRGQRIIWRQWLRARGEPS
jgi:uncharacterized hydrophobic protein (TIGR00271 family)